MRKLILRMSMSLDGFVARSNGELEWIFSNIDEESIAFGVAPLWEAGVHAMGRVTYGAMAAHWPTSTEPWAPAMNQIPKVVFSKTLKEAPWGSPVALGSGLPIFEALPKPVDLKLVGVKTFPGGTVANTYRPA